MIRFWHSVKKMHIDARNDLREDMKLIMREFATDSKKNLSLGAYLVISVDNLKGCKLLMNFLLL